jgi:hypothetical protein
LKLEKLKLNELIKPNIKGIKNINLFQSRVLFIELYKLSKGNEIDFQFLCHTCSSEEEPVYSQGVFKIDDDFHYHEMKKYQIETSNFIFYLNKESQMDIFKETNKDKGILYILSYIKSIYQKSTEKDFEVQDIEELKTWFMDELPEEDYLGFMNTFKEIQPKIEIQGKYTCEFCGTTKDIEFKNLPDFIICY